MCSIDKRNKMSYHLALEAAGCEVLEYEYTGSYQGEWYALVKHEGEIGVVRGSYGSCSVCDAFEGEFGWDYDKEENYQERLADFGRGYLPTLPIDHEISQLEKSVVEYDWGDEREGLDYLKKWKKEYNL